MSNAGQWSVLVVRNVTKVAIPPLAERVHASRTFLTHLFPSHHNKRSESACLEGHFLITDILCSQRRESVLKARPISNITRAPMPSTPFYEAASTSQRLSRPDHF
jgi:hypothetical protein